MSGSRWWMNIANALLVSLALWPADASASGDILCDATDGSGASIQVGIGHLPVLSVLSATATDGSTIWSTHAEGAETPILFGQGYIDDRQILIDFTDPNLEQIVVSLRLFHVSAEQGFAEAGTLSFEGVSAFPVQCENG